MYITKDMFKKIIITQPFQVYCPLKCNVTVNLKYDVLSFWVFVNGGLMGGKARTNTTKRVLQQSVMKKSQGTTVFSGCQKLTSAMKLRSEKRW